MTTQALCPNCAGEGGFGGIQCCIDGCRECSGNLCHYCEGKGWVAVEFEDEAEAELVAEYVKGALAA